MKLRVEGYRVLVQKDDIEKVSQGGIVIVTDEKLEKHRINTGRVLGVGRVAFKAFSNDYTGEPWCKVGDRIIWAEYAGKSVTDPATGNEVTIINDGDVIAVIEEN